MTRTPSIEVDTLRHQVIVGIVPHGQRGSRPGEFHYPASVAVSDGLAYVVDSWNHRVQVFSLPDWRYQFEFGDFFRPSSIAVVSDRGEAILVVVDTNSARLCLHKPDGSRIRNFEFQSRRFPVAACVTDSETVEVIFDNDHTETFDIETLLRPQWWTTKLERPISIVRDRAHFIYVSDFGRRTVEKFETGGAFIDQILGPESLNVPGKMAMNGSDLLITDRAANTVWIYDTVAGTCRKWDRAFESPGVIGRDENGAVWVAPYKLDPDADGTVFDIFSSDYRWMRSVHFHESRQPTSIAFAGGHVFVADQAEQTVFVFTTEGTFAGSIRENRYDDPVWSVATDGSHLYVGTGPVVDVLPAPDLSRLYYIDFENSSVRYSETCAPPSKL